MHRPSHGFYPRYISRFTLQPHRLTFSYSNEPRRYRRACNKKEQSINYTPIGLCKKSINSLFHYLSFICRRLQIGTKDSEVLTKSRRYCSQCLLYNGWEQSCFLGFQVCLFAFSFVLFSLIFSEGGVNFTHRKKPTLLKPTIFRLVMTKLYKTFYSFWQWYVAKKSP